MKVYLAADHRGFELKEKIKKSLQEEDRQVDDLGAHEYREDDDYPLYAERVGRAIQVDPESRGILFCGSGVGATAAVNKIRGVRASVGFDPEQVSAGRHDDDMNVLVIAADFTSTERAESLIESFLETSFDQRTGRYQHRINQIKELEERS